MPQGPQEHGPWEKYANPQQEHGPWEKYAAAPAPPPMQARPPVPPQAPEPQLGGSGFENYQAPAISHLLSGAAKSVPGLTGGLTGFEQGPQGLSPEEMRAGMQRATEPQNEAEKAGQIIGTTAQMLPWGALGAPRAAAKLADIIPSAARAGEKFQGVMSVAKNQAVPITDELSGALSRYQQLVDAGGSRSLAVHKLLNRITNPEKPPLTYEEARNFYSNISRLSADEFNRLTPVMRQQVGAVRAALNNAIQNTATAAGTGADYAEAMSEYAKAARLKEFRAEGWQAVKSKLPWLATAIAGKKVYDVLK